MGCIRGPGVDVDAGSEFLCERGIFRSTPDRSYLVAKLVPKLDSEVSEAADTLHCNQTVWRRAAVSQRIESSDSSTQQRSRFGIAECIWYRRQCFDRSDHVLLISSVVANACHFGVLAIKEASTPAFDTGVVLPAMPSHADALPFLPSGNFAAQCIDDARNSVPRNPRILNSRPEAFLHKHIAVADTTSLYLDQDLSRARLRNFPFDNLELPTRFGDLRRSHRCGRYSCGCHNSSKNFKGMLVDSATSVSEHLQCPPG